MGTLVLARDASAINGASWTYWKDAMVGVIVQVLAIVLLTVLLVRWSLAAPMARMARWMRDSAQAGSTCPACLAAAGFFQPVAHEVVQLVSSLEVARASAQRRGAAPRRRGGALDRPAPARARAEQARTPAALRDFEPRAVHPRAQGDRGRSRRSFRRAGSSPRSSRSCAPATARGSRTAPATPTAKPWTRAIALRVPQDDPEYTLRRVWLTSEEEEGYYYGFSNEGLWPLCHIAHTRPIFRAGGLGQLSAGQPEVRASRCWRN